MATALTGNPKPKRKSLTREKKRLIFYILVLTLPLIQFAIFYIYVNFNSIIMAFSTYEDTGLGYSQKFGFQYFAENMSKVFDTFKKSPYLITNSLILFVFETIIGLPSAIIFSFYIYKKRPLSKIFRVTLFMPQIISGVVFASIYSYLLSAIGSTFGNPSLDMLSATAGVDKNRVAMIVFSVAMSFGVNVLLFSGGMGNINPSLIEAAQLDGCNSWHELIHVVIPSIFPTIVSFVVVGLAGIFTNQMFLAHIKISHHELDTIGYFLYYQAEASDYVSKSDTILNYPQLSCISLLITAVLFPLTLGVKKLLEKYGPSTK